MPDKMAAEVLHLLEPAVHAQALADFDDVKKRLGEPGAVRRVAELTLRVAGEKA